MYKTLFIVLAIVFVVFIFNFPSLDRSRLMRVHFINVGYGSSVFIELPNGQNLLVDAGPKGQAQHLIEYIKSLNIGKINKAVLTHPHKDHFGGFDEIFKHFIVEEFYFNGDERNPHEGYFDVMAQIKEDVEPKVLSRGDRLELFSGIIIEVLHPKSLTGTANEEVIVLWIEYGTQSFLLTSDLPEQEQGELVDLFLKLERANFVQVPHHGGAINDKFASRLSGKTFILSVGENEYQNPSVEQLNKLKGKIVRTDKEGDVVIESDGRKAKIIK
ncbi:MAG: MBL fold metallo-hydrolase [Candidatus Zapsychrus exili]|nr:MBL fold metallo-hydrolase [Candidatus Zapsychrus exili]